MNTQAMGVRGVFARAKIAVAAAMSVAALLWPFAVVPQDAQAQGTGEPTTLVVATYGGQAGAVLRKIYEPFEKQYNVKINWAVGGSSSQNVAKIAATKARPEYDLAFGDNMTQYAGSVLGLWAPIDESIVTSYKDLAPQAKIKTGDGLSYGAYLAGYLYNPVDFKKNGWAPPTTWDDLLRPELCGKVGIMHPNVMYGVHVLIGLADGDAAKVPDAIAKLGKYKKCIQVLEPTTSKFDERIQMGDYEISARGSIGSIALIEKGLPLKFVVPTKGSMISFSTLAVVKGTQHMKLAQEFCNWILRPDMQTLMMQESYYTPTNSTVAIPPKMLALGVPDAAALAHGVVVSEQVVTDQRRDWIRQLERALEK